MKARYVLVPGILLSCMMACSGSEIQSLDLFDRPATVKESVVYGSDDRMDLYQITSPEWRERALSTVALVSTSKVVAIEGGGFSVKSMAYGKSMGLCKDEPFYDQISSAFCSGSLIAPDVILTAGHCLRNQTACDNTKFLFKFAYKSLGSHPVNLATNDVYGCKELIHTEQSNPGQLDFALVRLDRPVVGYKPLAVRQSGRIEKGEGIAVIGYPKGIPLKMSGDAWVRENHHRYHFVANLDTYAGNSGSAVFNEKTGVVEGVLVRGEQDFEYTEEGCYKSKVCGDDECRGEDVTRVEWALKHLTAEDLSAL